MTTKKLPLPWTTVYANSTTPKVIPVTGWMRASEIDKVRVTVEIAALQGSNLQITPIVQYANVETTITGDDTVGSTNSADGVYYPSAWTSVASATEANQLARFGWQVALSAGSILALATVGGVAELEVC